MPLPFSQLVGFPQQDPQMAMMQELMGSLQGQMDMGMPGPTMEEPPGRPNPLASMGAIFAASLADQLGGRRQHLAGAQRNIAQAEQAQEMAEQRNMAREEQGRRESMKRNLDLQLQSNSLRMKMAERVGDMEGARKALENEWKILDRQKKIGEDEQRISGEQAIALEEKRQEGRVELKGMDQASRSGTAGGAPGGMTATQRSVAQERVRKRMDAFFRNDENFDIKGKKRFRPDSPHHRIVKGNRRLAGQAIAREMIVNAEEPSEKVVALAHYLDTIRNDQGLLDLSLPGAVEFDTWIRQIIPDPDQWLIDLGALE